MLLIHRPIHRIRRIGWGFSFRSGKVRSFRVSNFTKARWNAQWKRPSRYTSAKISVKALQAFRRYAWPIFKDGIVPMTVSIRWQWIATDTGGWIAKWADEFTATSHRSGLADAAPCRNVAVIGTTEENIVKVKKLSIKLDRQQGTVHQASTGVRIP